MSERGQLLSYVVLPIAALSLLLSFAPNDLSVASKIGWGAFFAMLYGPLMYLRIRNR